MPWGSLARRSRPWLVLFALFLTLPQAHALSLLYDFALIAREGMTTAEGDVIEGIGSDVSVNEAGQVAFIANMPPGSNLMVGQSSNTVRNISQSRDARFYGLPQINNQGVIVTRELMGGRSVVRTWRASNPGEFTLIASTALSAFTQLTIPTIANTDLPSHHPLVGFLGRESDLPFAYYANATGQRNVQNKVSSLAGETMTSFRAMAAHSTNWTFAAQFSTADDHGEVLALCYDDNAFAWESKVIATTGTGTNWTWLGASPGISDSGKVIAFVGQNASAGEGIYIATAPTSFSTDPGPPLGVITTNSVIGYGDQAQPITLKSFDRLNRVGVLHEERGRPGFADDVITVCFMATPSRASRTNSALPGSPLLFSDQPGIWSQRIDVDTDLAAPHGLKILQAPPVAVAQVGDKLDGAVVTSLHLYDPLGLALADKHGNTRIPGVGDHYIAFAASTGGGVKVIRAGLLDADGDGLVDYWETYGLDIDRDGKVDLNLRQLGASPTRKDIFLELDWTVPRRQPGDISWTNAPPPGATQRMAQMFAEAPITNLDGSTGIQLHVDAGPSRDPAGSPYSVNMGTRRGLLRGGELIGMPGDPLSHPDMVFLGLAEYYIVPGVATRSLDSIKAEFFGGGDKCAREFAFRYAVLADFNDFARHETAWTNLTYAVASATSNTITSATLLSTNVESGHAIKIVSGRGAGQVRTIGRITARREMRLYPTNSTWAVIPDNTSGAAILLGASGRAEVIFRPGPIFHSLAANDFLVTLGGFGVNAGGWLGVEDVTWRTLAHECGHTLGLRHGGTDHDNYKLDYFSIMNYEYQFGHTNFSGPADIVFNDWDYLRCGFQNDGYILGNSFGRNPLWGAEPTPDPTVADYERLVGHPIDLQLPEVSITAPSAGFTLSPGANLEVHLSAVDASGISLVKVYFDIDGDGECSGDEVVTASMNAAPNYSATFHNVTGPKGVRKVRVIAEDTSGNQRAVEVPVAAGSTGETGTVLRTSSGTFAVQPAAGAGGKQQTARIGPVQIPGSGQLMLGLSVAPPMVASGGGTNRVNATITKIEFAGEDMIGWNIASLGSGDPLLSTGYWLPPSSGALYVELAGPAFQDGDGVFLGSPPQNYTLTLSFRAVDLTPPEAHVLSPATNGFVGLGETLVVRTEVTDDYGVASVTVRFDVNGDGDTMDAGEVVTATLESPGVYTASFPGLGGTAGNRAIQVDAIDTSGHQTKQMSVIEVRAPDTTSPSLRIITPVPGALIQRGSNLSAQVETSDDRGLQGVSISFDLNGDGVIAGTNEILAGIKTGPFTMKADFGSVTGALGPRMVIAVAQDTSGNTNIASVPVTVGGLEPVSETLMTNNGTIRAQGSQWVGGQRQITNFGPVTLSSAGTVKFTVTSTPNCRQTTQNISRYDPCVDQVTFNGKVSSTTQSWNPPGSNPAVCTSTFVVSQPGTLTFRILGAAVYNSWGEFDGSPAQTYSLNVDFESVDNVAPNVAIAAPARGANIEPGLPLTVDVLATDNVNLASLLVYFDANGDREIDDYGETISATLLGSNVYRAVFPNVTGPPGTRAVEVLATDTSLNTTYQSITVGCGGVGGGETLVFSRDGVITDIGSRQTLKMGPLAITGVGRLTLRVTSTPSTRQAYQNLTRYDAAVWAVRFNGQKTDLVPQFNPPGSNPAVGVSVWDSPEPGTLEIEVVGPAVYNSWGEYSGHPTTSYTLDVLYRPGPAVTGVTPATGSIAGGDTVKVAGAGFSLNPTVLFGEVAAQSVVRLNSGELTCRIPPGVAGKVAVTVLNSDPEGQPWNYGPPYGLFGRLTNAFTYLAPASEIIRGGERLLGTYRGSFAAVDLEQPQGEATDSFNLPGEGRLRFEAWAFVPILSPIPGPFDQPDDLSYHNESSAVHSFVGGDGWRYYTTIESSDITYPYGPVVTEGKAVTGPAAAGTARFTIKGPARWNAFWRQFGEFEMVSAPAQNWGLAVWFAARPGLLSVSPQSGGSGGGTLVTITGSNFVNGVEVLFGGVAATDVQVASPTSLTCRTPPGLRGAVSLELEFAGMKSSLPAGFRFAELLILKLIPPGSPGLPAVVHLWTETGKRYQLQRCTRLAQDEPWQNVGQPVAGNGDQQAFTDLAPPQSSGCAFYRIAEL